PRGGHRRDVGCSVLVEGAHQHDRRAEVEDRRFNRFVHRILLGWVTRRMVGGDENRNYPVLAPELVILKEKLWPSTALTASRRHVRTHRRYRNGPIRGRPPVRLRAQ